MAAFPRDLLSRLCWALVYSDREQGKVIIGCTRDGFVRVATDDPKECTNFLGYLAPNEEVPAYWQAEADAEKGARTGKGGPTHSG